MDDEEITVNLTAISREYIENLPPDKREIALQWYQANQELTAIKLFEAFRESGGVARMLARVAKGKRGPKQKYNLKEQARYRAEWDSVKVRRDCTLEEWLEDRFGCDADGNLNISKSTFYTWNRE